MPKRTDIQSVMIIGSGPIVIGQACEFDYSGTQACKALKEEGYRVILVNSNPATIMTDPGTADACYVEPLSWEMCAKVIEKERPDVLLPTLGGQTGLNVAIALAENGVLEQYNVEMIGADLEAINKAESRDLFRSAMDKIGLKAPSSRIAHTMEEANQAKKELGLPVIIRPAFTMGGIGGGLAFNEEEFEQIASSGLYNSPVNEILIETSILGWKEYEMEVMRDKKDNVVIICSIENVDALGIHTGDSITVAPAQTLTDKEYQRMRDASIAVIREIGVETGGANVQFAVNPKNGELVIIEMNPRVSRSSALASKATGFPIAKIAAKLAIGYTLDELMNDITQETPACFEPSIDYVVTKVPRFTFEKFPQAKPVLSSQMKSVGEAMAIGRTFKESVQKAMRSLETGYKGLGADGKCPIKDEDLESILDAKNPGPDRILGVKRALELGWSVEKAFQISQMDYWFLHQINDLVQFEKAELIGQQLESVSKETLYKAKTMGYSDFQLGYLLQITEGKVRNYRKKLGIEAVFKTVDTCAAEFKAFTPYHYSTYEEENESVRTDQKKVIIIGGGPNRIGQGIEFDYCCCHASYALQEEGYESIMVNSNPETVSTDYDTSDKLYFEPLNLEEILRIVEFEKPDGVIVQFGGQTPLKLANALHDAGVPILGTSPKSIEIAEDRKLFAELVEEIGILQPPNGLAINVEEAVEAASGIGYPVLVRPSFVLGGRAMMIVYNEKDLREYMTHAVEASEERPVLIDKFLEKAVEFDVDAISDGNQVVVAGLMQHVEEAGVHSGDSACVLPPYDLDPQVESKLIEYTTALATKLNVVGLMNIQYAVQEGSIYIIEANPRASRTIPFVSKAIGIPLASLATKILVGRSLEELGFTERVVPNHVSVKESVFPFAKFHGVDTVLSPEMKSTGEVMGADKDWGIAFAKAQLAAGTTLVSEGKVFLSVNDRDKSEAVEIASDLHGMGFEILATEGTAKAIKEKNIPCLLINKVHEGSPNVVDLLQNKEVALLVNSPLGKEGSIDDGIIRKEAMLKQIPYTTTLAAARAVVQAIRALKKVPLTVTSLQEYHAESI
jgi:carbamoyl-phosphate synthase large subunit